MNFKKGSGLQHIDKIQQAHYLHVLDVKSNVMGVKCDVVLATIKQINLEKSIKLM